MESIEDYIKNHMKFMVDKPFIFATHEHMLHAIKCFEDLKLQVSIKKEEGSKVSCRHFPYICDEMMEEHSKQPYALECRCNGGKYCMKYVPIYRSYLKFRDSDYMKEFGTCSNNCCCIMQFDRYVVKII